MSGQAEAPMDLSHEPLTGIKLGKKKYKMMHGSLNSRSNPIIGEKLPESNNNNEVRLLSLPSKQVNTNSQLIGTGSIQLISNELKPQIQSPPSQQPQSDLEINQAVDFKNVDKEINRKRHPAEVQTSNPILRGKHGLRPLPQQVDYYQSILEDRKGRVHKDSKTIIHNDSIANESTPTKRSKRLSSDHSKPNSSSSTASSKEPRKIEEQAQVSKELFSIGDIVWATLPTYKTWFPGLIISHVHCGQRPAKNGSTWVYWFGDHQVSEIPKAKVKSFINHFNDFSKGTSSLTSSRMKEALQVLANRAGIVFDLSNDNDEQMINWAKNGFKVADDKSKSNPFAPDPINPIPSICACYLPIDLMNQQASRTDDRSQQIAFYEVESAETVQEEKDEPLLLPEFKQTQVNRIKSNELKITDICIACCCDHNQAADIINGNKIQHPLFDGLLCKQCNETIKCTMYAPGEDNKNSFCAICGQVGKLAVCDNSFCHRVFCFVCIQLYIGSEEQEKIVEANTWECYLCNEKNLPSTALLKVKPNWRLNVKYLYDPIKCLISPSNEPFTKRPIKVLSLLDGFGPIKLVLNLLKIQVSQYYAIENETDSLEISKRFHDESITFIPKLDDLTPEKIAAICPIDLIVCSLSWNDLSATNTSRKGYFDYKGNGHPFLHFVHALNLVRQFNNDNHVFFLFDTLTSIPNQYRDTISHLLMTKPVTVNSLYQLSETSQFIWSNIPGVNRPIPNHLKVNIEKLTKFLKLDYSKEQTDEVNTDEKTCGLKETENLLNFIHTHSHSPSRKTSANKLNTLLHKAWSIPLSIHSLWALFDFFKKE